MASAVGGDQRLNLSPECLRECVVVFAELAAEPGERLRFVVSAQHAQHASEPGGERGQPAGPAVRLQEVAQRPPLVGGTFPSPASSAISAGASGEVRSGPAARWAAVSSSGNDSSKCRSMANRRARERSAAGVDMSISRSSSVASALPAGVGPMINPSMNPNVRASIRPASREWRKARSPARQDPRSVRGRWRPRREPPRREPGRRGRSRPRAEAAPRRQPFRDLRHGAVRCIPRRRRQPFGRAPCPSRHPPRPPARNRQRDRERFSSVDLGNREIELEVDVEPERPGQLERPLEQRAAAAEIVAPERRRRPRPAARRRARRAPASGRPSSCP